LTTACVPAVSSEIAAMKIAATTADQKIAAARSEAIIFHERPIVCPNLE
jgi:hypothetical protein